MLNNMSYTKNLDSRLDKVNEEIRKHFDISTKGFFVLLLNYGLENNISTENYTVKGKGSQFRSETDRHYNETIFILLSKYLKKQVDDETKLYQEIIDVMIDRKKFDNVFDQLITIANAAGIHLLDNELASYKHNISKKEEQYFVIDVLNTLIKPLESVIPF